MRQLPFCRDATGMDVFSCSDDVLKSGERINNLVRLFNLREGLTREQDRLPKRFMEQPLEDGPARGRVVDLSHLLNEYYLVRGWDEEGVPKNKKLKELNLDGLVKSRFPGENRRPHQL